MSELNDGGVFLFQGVSMCIHTDSGLIEPDAV